MNKKNGFTLTELLGGVVILIIVMSISMLVVSEIKNRTLQKQYENEISYIETKAAKYAEDTGITYVNVETLIKEGYLDPDDTTDIYNPKDGSSLNCYYVNVDYTDGVYSGNFDEDSNLVDDAGNCETIEVTSDIKIQRCDLDGENCIDLNNKDWFSDNVKLKVVNSKGETLENVERYNWYNIVGYSSNEEMIQTNVNTGEASIINYRVAVDYQTQDNKRVKSEAQGTVRIDRQVPAINNLEIDGRDTWTNEGKKITLTVTDYSGSGVKGVFIGETDVCNKDLNYDLLKENQTVYVTNSGTEPGVKRICIIDAVGNVGGGTDENDSDSSLYEIKIDQIDVTPPTCEIKATSEPDGKNGWYHTNVKLEMEDFDAESGVIERGLIQGTTTATYNKQASVIHTSNTSKDGVIYYGYVKDRAGNTGKCEYKVRLDKNAPTCTITITSGTVGTNGWYTSDIDLKLDYLEKESGVKYKGLTLSKEPIYNDMETEKVIGETKEKVYYCYVQDESGWTGSNSITLKIDKTGPEYLSSSGNGASARATYKDELSDISKIEYYSTNNSTVPDKNSTAGWAATPNVGSSCGNTYSIYSRATNNAGLNSNVTKISTYSTGSCPSYSSGGGGGGGRSSGGGSSYPKVDTIVYKDGTKVTTTTQRNGDSSVRIDFSRGTVSTYDKSRTGKISNQKTDTSNYR